VVRDPSYWDDYKGPAVPPNVDYIPVWTDIVHSPPDCGNSRDSPNCSTEQALYRSLV